ncbi:MAG TPA: ThiF family adenylyltransferase [Tepidisphaeraceae bacterium]|jgi:hypothetical protein|nr:ThiF family adenylyltransferase [Tepidisphaeraceae bacterium]
MIPSGLYANRDLRQRELVPPHKLAACHALVIGVGAIGRQVALQLAAMGAGSLELFDHDHVGPENLAPQGFWNHQVGQAKVQATGEHCRLINPQLRLTTHARRFARSSARQLVTLHSMVIFCCVDQIQTRRLIWETLHQRAAFFVDGRMSAEVIRVLSCRRPDREEHYPTTLFAAEQAYGGSCTARSTIYTASIAAGLMLGQFTRWLRDLPTDPDLSLNLLASEMSCGLAVAPPATRASATSFPIPTPMASGAIG